MKQADTARAFAALHVKGDPVVLYNIWDAGSAQAIADAGARAVATGSASVAAAQGYPDGERIPLDLVVTLARRIVESVDIPVTLDFEGAYAAAPEAAVANVGRVLEAGVVGINFEDQVVGGEGLYGVEAQAARIAAIRARADEAGVPLFINARTDLFLKEMKTPERHAGLVSAALERAAAYAEAGASGFFIPAARGEDVVGAICAGAALPVNVMAFDPAAPIAPLAALGVARVSHGPFPYRGAMAALTEKAREALAARHRA